MKNKTAYFREILFFLLSLSAYSAALLFSVYGNFVTAADMVLVSTVLLDIFILNYIFSDIRKHAVLFFFTACYNLLMLGRVFVLWIKEHDIMWITLEADSPESFYRAVNLLYLALFFVFAAYRFSGPLFRQRELLTKAKIVKNAKSEALVPIIKIIAFVFFIISFFGEAYSLIITAKHVITGGYLNSFINSAQIPVFAEAASVLYLPSFVLLLAARPSKKFMITPLTLYLITMGLSLLSGRRNMLVRDVIMLVIYFIMRDNLREKALRYINKFRVFICSLIGLFGVYFLHIMSNIRDAFGGLASNSENMSFILTIIDFIYDQGVSFRVIIKTIMHENLLDPQIGYKYILYPIELMVNNIFSLMVAGNGAVSETQSEAFVESTNNIAHKLVYIVDPQRYLSGGGYGTAFVAEGYMLAGILGVILLSFVIGIILRFFPSLMSRSVFTIAFGLIAVRYLVYIPRNFALGFLTETFNPIYLIFYLSVFIIAVTLNYSLKFIKKIKLSDKEEQSCLNSVS